MLGGGEEREVLHGDYLAELRRRLINDRGEMPDPVPYAVDPSFWEQARNELDAHLRTRGWKLSHSAALVRRGVEHFLFCGVPIVMADG